MRPPDSYHSLSNSIHHWRCHFPDKCEKCICGVIGYSYIHFLNRLEVIRKRTFAIIWFGNLRNVDDETISKLTILSNILRLVCNCRINKRLETQHNTAKHSTIKRSAHLSDKGRWSPSIQQCKKFLCILSAKVETPPHTEESLPQTQHKQQEQLISYLEC